MSQLTQTQSKTFKQKHIVESIPALIIIMILKKRQENWLTYWQDCLLTTLGCSAHCGYWELEKQLKVGLGALN